MRTATLVISALALLMLPWTQAGATDNHGYMTTTLTGESTNYGTIEIHGDSQYGMRPETWQTATNAASGVIRIWGDYGSGIRTYSAAGYNYGAVSASGTNSTGMLCTDSGAEYNFGTISVDGDHSEGIFGYNNVVIHNYGTITITGDFSTGIRSDGYVSGGSVYNAGTISASGANAHAIHIVGTDVHLMTGSRILSGDVFGSRNGSSTYNNLYLEGSGTLDFDVSGEWRSIFKTGSGTWTMAQNISTNINLLQVDGGTLAVAPGVSFAAPNGYVQSAGTGLLVSVDGTVTPLAISGTATLAGTLLVDPGPGGTVLTAAGGLGGTTFDAVASVNPHFTVTVQYPDANTVTATSAFAPQWDAPARGVSATLAASRTLSGVALARGSQRLAQAPREEDDPILVASTGSLEGLGAGGGEDPAWGMYFKPLFAVDSFRPENNALGMKAHTLGFELGLDRFISDKTLLGFMAGYSYSLLRYSGSSFVNADSEEQYMVTLGSYAGWRPGSWRITDALSLSRVQHASRRNAGLSQTAKADYASWLAANQIQAAYVLIPAEGWEIAPRLGLETVHLHRSGFEETGAVNAVRYDNFDQTFWEGTIALRATHRLEIQGKAVTPHAGIGYSRTLGDNDVTVRQYLASTSARVTTENDDERMAMEAGVTLDHQSTKATLAYEGEYGESSRFHEFSATLRWEF